MLKSQSHGGLDHTALRAVPRNVSVVAEECSRERRQLDRAMGTEGGETVVPARRPRVLNVSTCLHLTYASLYL